MAVNVTPVANRLQLILQTGTDAQGNPVLVTRNYNRVKPSATDQAVFDVAQQLADLQIYPLIGVNRVSEDSITPVA